MNGLWRLNWQKTRHSGKPKEIGPKSKFHLLCFVFICFVSGLFLLSFLLLHFYLKILSSVRSIDYWANMGEFNEMGWAGAGTYQPSWPLDKMDMLSLPFFVHVLSWSHIVIMHWLIMYLMPNFPFYFTPFSQLLKFWISKRRLQSYFPIRLDFLCHV